MFRTVRGVWARFWHPVITYRTRRSAAIHWAGFAFIASVLAALILWKLDIVPLYWGEAQTSVAATANRSAQDVAALAAKDREIARLRQEISSLRSQPAAASPAAALPPADVSASEDAAALRVQLAAERRTNAQLVATLQQLVSQGQGGGWEITVR